jgi:hypothetical protein
LVANPPSAESETAFGSIGSSGVPPVGAISANDEPVIVLASATIAFATVEAVRVVVMAAMAGAASTPREAAVTRAIAKHFAERVICDSFGCGPAQRFGCPNLQKSRAALSAPHLSPTAVNLH